MSDKKIIKNRQPSNKSAKDRSLTEERLIRAAEQLFAEHGFNGATTRMIAQKADVNIALINRYFDGKEGLFLRIIKDRSHLHINEFANSPVQKTLTDECKQFLSIRFKRHRTDSRLFKMVMIHLLTDAKFKKRFEDSLVELDDDQEMINRISNLQKAKKVHKKLNPREFVDMLKIQHFGAFIIGHIIECRSNTVIDQYLDNYCHTLCHGFEL